MNQAITNTSSLRGVKLLSLVALCAALPMAASFRPTQSASAGVPPVATPMPALMKASQSFVPNQGQWDARAQFLAKGPGMNLWITEDGAVFDFYRIQGSKESATNHKSAIDNSRIGHAVRMEFVGGNASSVVGEGKLEGTNNYFIGNDASRHAANVPRYAEVWSEKVYDGVEARWYFDQGRPRYDLVVAPGADPSKIAMRYSGAKSVGMRGKSLVLDTSVGEVEHRGLFAYQKVNGATKQIACDMRVTGNVVRFDVGAFDRTKPLVIDPLIWSTFVGGATFDRIVSLHPDSAGNIVFAGLTDSAAFPVTVGAYDVTFNGGSFDTIAGKMTPNGTSIVWATYLGGSLLDEATSVDLTSTEDVVLFGRTFSANYPTTALAFDTTYNASSDAVISKLNSTGSSLIYSTYIGSTGFDAGYDGLVLPNDDYIMCGSAGAVDFPLANAIDSTYALGEGFVLRLQASGLGLVFSTFVGGADSDQAYSITFDGVAGLAVLFFTQSTDFPTTTGAFDEDYNGAGDMAVVTMPIDGTSIIAGTFIGGTNQDVPNSIDWQPQRGVALTGYAFSTDFPTSASAVDKTHNGNEDMAVAVLSSDLTTLVGSTYLGGTGGDEPWGIACDPSGNVFVVGLSDSPDYPTVAHAYDPTPNGLNDAVLTKFNPDLSKRFYSTVIGSTNNDYAASVTFDGLGDPIIAGSTGSSGFPTTTGVFDQTFNGGTNDAFIAKFNTRPFLTSFTSPNTKVIGGFQFPVTIRISEPGLAGGTPVNLTTNTPGKVFVPPVVNVKQGALTRSFGVRTEFVKTDTVITVTATYNGGSDTVTVTLKPGGLQSLKIPATTIGSLELAYGTVLLSAPVPVGVERVVELRPSNPLALFVPSEVVVIEGYDSANFPVYGMPVMTDTPVTVFGKLGSQTKSDTIIVTP